jgi:hypothetical protein
MDEKSNKFFGTIIIIICEKIYYNIYSMEINLGIFIVGYSGKEEKYELIPLAAAPEAACASRTACVRGSARR